MRTNTNFGRSTLPARDERGHTSSEYVGALLLIIVLRFRRVGLAGVITANYDLREPETRAALDDALATIGITSLRDRPLGLTGAPGAFAGAFGTYDNLSIVTYDTTTTSVGGGFEVGNLIAFGAEGSCTQKESDVRSARYLTPSGWRERVSCTG